MKKSILRNISAFTFIAALAFSNIAKADDPAFDKGSNTIGISIGLGGYRHAAVYNYGHNYSNVDLPAFSVIYDHGFFGEVGPGTIGIGGLVGYQYSFLNNYGGYNASWSNFVVAVRGTYHLTILKDKNNHFDPYAGVMAGIRFETVHNSYYDYYGDSYDAGGALPIGGAFVGAKYNFTKAFGAFAEAGYGFSFLSIGLNFNF